MNANEISVIMACTKPLPKSSSGKDAKEVMKNAETIYKAGKGNHDTAQWNEFKTTYELKIDELVKYCGGNATKSTKEEPKAEGKKAKAEKTISVLEKGLKYLKGEKKAKAEKTISVLKKGLKYLR